MGLKRVGGGDEWAKGIVGRRKAGWKTHHVAAAILALRHAAGAISDPCHAVGGSLGLCHVAAAILGHNHAIGI